MIPVGYLRSLSDQFLPDTCTIQQGTETASGDGTSTSWTTKQADVPCRVSPLASSAIESLGGQGAMTAVAQWTVWLPAGTDVTVRDRIAYQGRTFEVARVGARSFEVSREVLCREVV